MRSANSESFDVVRTSSWGATYPAAAAPHLPAPFDVLGGCVVRAGRVSFLGPIVKRECFNFDWIVAVPQLSALALGYSVLGMRGSPRTAVFAVVEMHFIGVLLLPFCINLPKLIRVGCPPFAPHLIVTGFTVRAKAAGPVLIFSEFIRVFLHLAAGTSLHKNGRPLRV